MAARSVKVAVTNQTDKTLRKLGAQLEHGIWVKEPPDTIEPNSTVKWESESRGIMTGTEGWAQYEIVGVPESAKFKWNNPYIGRNTYAHDTPPGYEIRFEGGGGDNTTIIFFLNVTKQRRSS